LIFVHRNLPGVGDAVMMEPVLRRLSQGNQLTVCTKYPDLFTGMYDTVDTSPPNTVVLSLGSDDVCPCAAYELDHIDNIKKGRVQLFMESVGFTYCGEVPQLRLKPEELKESRSMRTARPRIGLSTISRNYDDPLDGWRNYPYSQTLITELCQWSEVVWLHNEPINAQVEWGEWTLREVMIRVASLGAVIGIDSGPAHIAGALGVPVFGLFGPTNPELRIAGYPNATWIEKHEACGRAYCWYKPCRFRFCLTQLKPKWISQWVRNTLMLQTQEASTIPSLSETKRMAMRMLSTR